MWSTFGVTRYWNALPELTAPIRERRRSTGKTSKATSRKFSRSVGIAVEENRSNGRQEDQEVEDQRPAIDILLVELDAALCSFDGTDFPAEALHLREARDARPNAMTTCIAAHRILVVMVADPHLERVGPRTDQRHVAPDHVQKLRKLIDAELAEDATDRGHARIILGRRRTSADVRLVSEHRPELEDVDHLIVEADAGLHEQDRPRTAQPDG